jgi:hypothetical protein
VSTLLTTTFSVSWVVWLVLLTPIKYYHYYCCVILSYIFIKYMM